MGMGKKKKGKLVAHRAGRWNEKYPFSHLSPYQLMKS
jgi:hypothetical protein